MRIDANVNWQIGAASDWALYPPEPPEFLLEGMEKDAIDLAVLSPAVPPAAPADVHRSANEATADVIARFPDRFVGCFRLSPRHALEGWHHAAGIRTRARYCAVKVCPEQDGVLPVETELWRAVFEGAGRLGWPVIIESQYPPFLQPLQFGRLAGAFPAVTVVLTHIGYRLSTDAILAALEYPNVVLETSENWDDIIASAVRRVGASRVMFGSNYPYSIPGFERLKIAISPWLTDEERASVLGDTAARVFGIIGRPPYR